MSVFIDTNIILYAIGKSSDLKKTCLWVLKEVSKGNLDATTDTEVVQEVLHVLIRRNEKKAAILVSRNVLGLFPGIIGVNLKEMETACDLLGRNAILNARDAVHLACMISGGIHTIISADKHFDDIEGTVRIKPQDEDAIRRLLRTSSDSA